VSSRETIIWAAQHRYPYIALNTSIEDSKKIWAVYDEAAEKAGYKGGPEQRGYLIRCHVQENEEKALANARQFMWMQGGVHRPAASRVGGAVGISRKMGAARIGRGSRRPSAESGGGSTVRDAVAADADRRGHTRAGRSEAPHHHGGDAALDHGVVGQRRERHA
jgi:alkanesulfonate monooxygenase SsuD/methylene tetrahydromethanopterin reductase-like flavin-dependent oxidoreductase (luciferase family)